jgi:small subunit ribosomal protein S21
VHYLATVLRKREVSLIAHIIVEDSENLEKAIKRFKRLVEKEGIIREWKKREFFEKPSTIKNRKNKAIQRKLLKKTRKGPHASPSSTRNA